MSTDGEVLQNRKEESRYSRRNVTSIQPISFNKNGEIPLKYMER
jgi:hypothetical protein